MQNREQGESYETLWAQAVQACADGKYQEAVDKGLLCFEFLNKENAKVEYKHLHLDAVNIIENDISSRKNYDIQKNFLFLKMLPCCILLSKCYILLNEREQGSRFLSQSVMLAKKKIHDDDGENGAIFSVIAEVFKLLNDSKGELAMYTEYLNYMEEKFGKNHVAVSDCYHLLAGYYFRNKRIDLAIIYSEKCLANRMEYFGRVNEVTEKSLYSLGVIYRAGGRLKEAFLTLLESIEIRSQLFGSTSLETAEAQASAGYTAQKMKEVKKARILFKLALDTFKTIYGEHHKTTIQTKKLYDNLVGEV